MRITNGALRAQSLAHVQLAQRGLAEAQRQVSSGRRIETAADDPSAASRAMRARGGSRALEQYQRNVEGASSRLQVEEQVLGGLGDALVRARELASAMGTDSVDTASRTAARQEVRELLAHAAGLANTRLAGEPLFGSAPDGGDLFGPEGTPAAGALLGSSRAVEVGPGRTQAVTHSAQELFVDDGPFAALRALDAALGSGNAAAVRDALPGLEGAYSRLQGRLGEAGARSNSLQATASTLDNHALTLDTLRSDLEDVEIERAVMDLASRQASYESAMLANSKILGLSLANYLR